MNGFGYFFHRIGYSFSHIVMCGLVSFFHAEKGESGPFEKVILDSLLQIDWSISSGWLSNYNDSG